MADAPVDFSSLDDSGSLYTPIDSSLPGITADSTDPFAVAPDPGLFGSVGPEPMVSDGVATADTLSSTDGISTSANTDFNFADGSAAWALNSANPIFLDSNGNELQGTQDANGYWHLSDGTVIDPATGNKWNDDGSSTPIDPSAAGSPAKGGTGGFSPVGGSGGSPIGGKGNSAGAASSNAAISKTLGALGASIASLFGKPQNPTAAQRAKNQATIAGQPSNLNMTGSSIFVIGSLALIFLLLKGK